MGGRKRRTPGRLRPPSGSPGKLGASPSQAFGEDGGHFWAQTEGRLPPPAPVPRPGPGGLRGEALPLAGGGWPRAQGPGPGPGRGGAGGGVRQRRRSPSRVQRGPSRRGPQRVPPWPDELARTRGLRRVERPARSGWRGRRWPAPLGGRAAARDPRVRRALRPRWPLPWPSSGPEEACVVDFGGPEPTPSFPWGFLLGAAPGSKLRHRPWPLRGTLGRPHGARPTVGPGPTSATPDR
ncbi:translation initiation factor IF-2-like [Suncus etruscus]|uniref:translation initiation factor IF-2-like n=1 Tax=Suncus etruscus TaxID=109475 RepID=UPI0021108DB6|nr:translation initiation factor IF-2-like [Suncus etruscus]